MTDLAVNSPLRTDFVAPLWARGEPRDTQSLFLSRATIIALIVELLALFAILVLATREPPPVTFAPMQVRLDGPLEPISSPAPSPAEKAAPETQAKPAATPTTSRKQQNVAQPTPAPKTAPPINAPKAVAESSRNPAPLPSKAAPPKSAVAAEPRSTSIAKVDAEPLDPQIEAMVEEALSPPPVKRDIVPAPAVPKNSTAAPLTPPAEAAPPKVADAPVAKPEPPTAPVVLKQPEPIARAETPKVEAPARVPTPAPVLTPAPPPAPPQDVAKPRPTPEPTIPQPVQVQSVAPAPSPTPPSQPTTSAKPNSGTPIHSAPVISSTTTSRKESSIDLKLPPRPEGKVATAPASIAATRPPTRSTQGLAAPTATPPPTPSQPVAKPVREPTAADRVTEQATRAAPMASNENPPAPIVAAKPGTNLPSADTKPAPSANPPVAQPASAPEAVAPLAEKAPRPAETVQKPSAPHTGSPANTRDDVASAKAEATQAAPLARADSNATPAPAPNPQTKEASTASTPQQTPRVPAHIASLPAESSTDTDDEARGRLTAQDIGLVYPRRAKRMKIGGTLFVRLIVADDGGVLDVEVIESDPPKIFDEAVEKAMMKLHYPPRKDNWVVEYDLTIDPPPGE